MQSHQRNTPNFNGNPGGKFAERKQRARADSTHGQLPPLKRRNKRGSPEITDLQSDCMPEEQKHDDMNWPLFGGPVAAGRQPDIHPRLMEFLGKRADVWKRPQKLQLLLEDMEEDHFKRWRSAGCQLCFVNNGVQARDHQITKCTSAGSDKANMILQWLDGLKLERFAARHGRCSLCGEIDKTGETCAELSAAAYFDNVDAEYKAAWRTEIDSAKGPDGLCENKKVVRETIAALCGYDGQILGRGMAKLVSENYDIDLAVKEQATQWFEQQVESRKNWIPQMLLVYDLLVASFDFLRDRGIKRPIDGKVVNAPKSEAGEASDADDYARDEVKEWKAIADWWKGKCSFCAGRGLSEEQIKHTLRTCNRGGKSKLAKCLGQAIYGEGFRAEGGCKDCAMPRELCQAWSKQGNRWNKAPGTRCQYGTQAYDTAIGFYYSDIKYRIRLAEAMADDEDEYDAGEEDDVAAWLGREIMTETGVQSSEIMRQLAEWTQMSKKR